MDMTPYIALLERLRFVDSVELAGEVLLVTTVDKVAHPVSIQHVPGTLNTARLSSINLVPPRGAEYSLVLAPRITVSAAQALRHFAMEDDDRVWYLDLGGNHLVYVGNQYASTAEGRPQPSPKASQRDIRSAGFRALFALLVDTRLINCSEREIAERAGVSRGAASAMAKRLREEGNVVEGHDGSRVLRTTELLDKWLIGYDAVLRPRLLARTYAMPTGGLTALEKRLEHFVRPDVHWAWGGHPAAVRLGGDYPGTTAAIHIDGLDGSSPLALPLDPAEGGPVTVLGVPGPLALEPKSDVVHPLLVVAELVREQDPRSIAMARELIARHGLGGET